MKKLCFTQEDVRENFDGPLLKIYSALMEHLPKLNIKSSNTSITPAPHTPITNNTAKVIGAKFGSLHLFLIITIYFIFHIFYIHTF